MTDCTQIYDLMTNGYETWWFPAFGLIGAAGAAVIYIGFATIFRNFVSPLNRKSMAVSVIGCLVWSIVMLKATYFQYFNLSKEYERGAYREVTGKVENFTDDGPGLQPGTEKFSVGGVPFSYSRFVVSAGFRETRDSGGPLREGALVRLRYIGNAIVRLEICHP